MPSATSGSARTRHIRRINSTVLNQECTEGSTLCVCGMKGYPEAFTTIIFCPFCLVTLLECWTLWQHIWTDIRAFEEHAFSDNHGTLMTTIMTPALTELMTSTLTAFVNIAAVICDIIKAYRTQPLTKKWKWSPTSRKVRSGIHIPQDVVKHSIDLILYRISRAVF